MHFAKTNNTLIATNGIRMSVSPDVRMCTRFFARLSNIHCYNPALCSTLQTLVLSIWRHWWHHYPKQGSTRQLNRGLDKYKYNLNSVPPHYWPQNKNDNTATQGVLWNLMFLFHTANIGAKIWRTQGLLVMFIFFAIILLQPIMRIFFVNVYFRFWRFESHWLSFRPPVMR